MRRDRPDPKTFSFNFDAFTPAAPSSVPSLRTSHHERITSDLFGAHLAERSSLLQVTSHIIGMLTRTIKLMESGPQYTGAIDAIDVMQMSLLKSRFQRLRNGIKPVYVFDGKPPEMKLLER